MKTAMGMVAALALLGACATELDLTESEPEPEPTAETQPEAFRFVVPYVHQPTVDLPPPTEPVADPCDCAGDHGCVDEWAESALSCEVCVVLLCDDEWHPHVCNYCGE